MSEVLIEDRGPARWLTLNRPEVMNAITGEMRLAAWRSESIA